MNNEIWLPSKTLSGTHEVSSHGRVRSIPRIVSSSFGAVRRIKGRIVGDCPKISLYSRISITQEGKQVGLRVHILIAEVFVPNPFNLPCVNHKDGNKLNNHPDNLEWCTHWENMEHARKTGLIPEQKKAVIAKLSDIGFWYPSLTEASRSTGATITGICKALKGIRQSRAKGMLWEYCNIKGEFAEMKKSQNK